MSIRFLRKASATFITNSKRGVATTSATGAEVFGKVEEVWKFRNEQKMQDKLSDEEFNRSIGVLNKSQIDLIKIALEKQDTYAAEEAKSKQSLGDMIAARFIVSAEVALSKIFPAGAGWQGGSIVASAMGYGSTDVPLFLMAGVGDAVGVGVGHFGYYAVKNMLGYKQDMESVAHTSVLLSTACIFSGTAWQPIVNFLHDTAHLGFNECVFGAFAGCGLAFFTGLRFARLMWSPMLSKIEPNNYGNLKADALLSAAVGGATGVFVGTDVSFVSGPESAPVDQNWLRPIVGVEEGTGDLQAMVTAGTSTALGFAAVQTAQNLTLKPGKNWVD